MAQITIKRHTVYTLTLDNGETFDCEKLGSGMFSTAYRCGNDVFIATQERDTGTDYSKEALQYCDPEDFPNLPKCEYIGDIETRVFGRENSARVYRMPYYEKLDAKKHPKAWAQLKALIAARQAAWDQVTSEERKRNGFNANIDALGSVISNRVVQLLENDPQSPAHELAPALQNLADAGANYGSEYCMEFSRKNVGVDETGRLILRDCLYSLGVVSAMHKAARKRSERRLYA